MVWISRCILAVLICVVGMIWLSGSRGIRASSAEIQLSTGDLRYVWEGNVVHVHQMPEPYRSTLLAASQRSRVLNDDWERCAAFPYPGSNRPDRMCHRFFKNAATWLDYEPAVGLHLAEDLARYVMTTGAEHSLPASFPLLSCVRRDANGKLFIPEKWREVEEFAPYLKEHGFEQQIREQ